MKAVNLIFLVLLILVSLESKQVKCLTGHKILVRQKIKQKDGREIYKLEYKCLCPNNYYGKQCENHIDIDCYLTGTNQENIQIDESNINEEIKMQLKFEADCWVGQRKRFLPRIKLQQYLAQFNKENTFGVRQQFGDGFQIVWANTTEIFDSEGCLKIPGNISNNISKQQELSEEERRILLIGNNTQLYENPFNYNDNFMGYRLINGDILYQTSIFHPEKGLISIANYTNRDVTIRYNEISPKVKDIDYKQYTQSLTDNQELKKYQQIVQKLIPNKGINSQVSQIPQIKVTVPLHPSNYTFYSAIRLSLDIVQKYQDTQTHQVSMNSLIYTLPVNLPNVGQLPIFTKNLTITSSNKTYTKILLLVAVVITLYLALVYGYKKYKKYKQKQYQQTDQNQPISYNNSKQISSPYQHN